MSNVIMNRAAHSLHMPLFLQPIKVEHAYGVLKTLKPAEEKVTNKCSCILDRQSNILRNIFFFLHNLLLYIKEGFQESFKPLGLREKCGYKNSVTVFLFFCNNFILSGST